MSRSLVIAIALVAASCWGPPAEGRLACGPVGECPSGWYCHTGNRCWSTPADAARDALDVPADAFDDPGDGSTVAYVLSHLEAPAPIEMRVPGFDLDGAPGMTGSRCDEQPADFTSSVTGDPNVDNQFGANVAGTLLPPEDFSVAFRDAIAREQSFIVLQLTDVDSYTSDGRVGAMLVIAQLPAATSLVLDGAGELAPGQSFEPGSVLWDGDVEIAGGRVSWSSTADMPIDFYGEVSAGFLLNDVRLAADVSASGLTRGELGGGIEFIALPPFLEDVGRLGIDEATLRGVAMPDLLPNADGSRCDGVSAGFSFIAVPATLL